MGSIGWPELIVVSLVILAGVIAVLRLLRSTAGGRGLVPCPSCRAKVSLRAKACPHCGDPLT